MKRFHFSLEKVLRLRTYREQEAELELGRAVGALTAVENRIKEAAREKQNAAGARFLQSHGAPEIINYNNYILRLEQETGRLLEDAAKAELVVEEKRAAYIEASRDRKVLDKLREKRERENRKDMLAEETGILDDVSGGKGAREAVKG
ncbi:MAG: flagellar export protein FliJ [Treponema sp.]|nr:flagellar export protein FliJ [Treponema sp.]